jgi:hypothetical protein
MTLAESDAKGNFIQMPGRNDFVIDIWTALCALEGSMVCRAAIREASGGIWVARRKRTRHVYASNLQREDGGNMDVWCPQTPYGTWVARFSNDVVTITGNTGAAARALAQLGFGTQFMPELDDDGSRPADSPREWPSYSGSASSVPHVSARTFGESALPPPIRRTVPPSPTPTPVPETLGKAENGIATDREVVPAPAPVVSVSTAAARPQAIAEIWEGPGQCPRCHAPEGKRHGKPCIG